jgi:hypothetical protein
MTALLRSVALVSESKSVTLQQLTPVSAAIDKQVQRDFAPLWEVSATVNAFGRLEDVPIDAWPVIVMDDIGTPGAAGVHLDKDGQPYALVMASDNIDEWSLTASHECLEMLADPFGSRLVAGDSPKPDQGRVRFLVEVCDPSEAADFAYTSNGVLVSDFYTPHFFDPVKAAGVRYSFTEAITEPREVLRGGYLSWQDLTTGDWWQEIWFDSDQPSFRNLGQFTGAANETLRSWIDRQTSRATRAAIAPARSAAMAAGLSQSKVVAASTARAGTLRREIEALLARPQGESDTGVVAGRRRPVGRTRSGRGRDSA